MSRFALPDFERAFRDGERFDNESIHVIEACDLVLPTGRIIACDPDYLLTADRTDARAYSRSVSPGRYPVSLAILGDAIACARVRFNDTQISLWEMALRPGWDPSTLKPGYKFGFGVDGGVACILDEQTALCIPDEQSAYFAAIELESDLQKWYRSIVPPAFGELFNSLFEGRGRCPFAWAWTTLDPSTGANIVAFPAGIGDGTYAAYFGIAEDESPVCLIIDFGLLVRPIMDTIELRVADHQKSVLTHPLLADAGIDQVCVFLEEDEREFMIDIGDGVYGSTITLENRPSVKFFSYQTQGGKHWYRLDEPLQETARIFIEYQRGSEAL